ncbi:MAG: xanthine phosphoribosyltransferase [Erysipelothrix sp.]|nr:xanthine phosphoribosyltransferase [Erysipelothrix sp.]
MEALKQVIHNESLVLNNSIIKADTFLNHQMNIELFNQMGQEFLNYFKTPIDKIVTCEASGIGLACIVAQYFKCNVVFAKKEPSLLMVEDYYTERVFSYTKQKESLFSIRKDLLAIDERILIIDDFLANGEALKGMISIVEQANAKVIGIGIAIEKGFQDGGKLIRQQGYDLKSLVIIDQIKNNELFFRE